jgi:hypothetical protein
VPEPPTTTRLLPIPRFLGRAVASRSRKMWRPASPTAESVRAPSRFFVRIFRRALSNLLVRIRNRRWNHIGSTRPLAQINRAAAVAAEGELRIAALHGLLADRAAKFQNTFARHGQGMFQVLAESITASKASQLQNLCHQIIIVSFRNLATIKLARLRLRVFRKVVHEDFAVDLRCMHRRAAFQEQICLF